MGYLIPRPVLTVESICSTVVKPLDIISYIITIITFCNRIAMK
ncbi:MAG: hypothetical protein ACTSU4_06045 [Promethearchaeota archaeon]